MFCNLINRKLTELLKTFFLFDIQKPLFFTEKNVFDFLNIYNELCAEHKIIEKNKIVNLLWRAEFRDSNTAIIDQEIS